MWKQLMLESESVITTSYHFVLWRTSQLSTRLFKTGTPQEEQNRIGFNFKVNHQIMSLIAKHG